jgi:hypothetical protein
LFIRISFNILIGGGTLIEIISYNGVWYVFFTDGISTISTPSFNASAVENNGNPFLPSAISAWAPFLGTSNGDFINNLSVCFDVDLTAISNFRVATTVARGPDPIPGVIPGIRTYDLDASGTISGQPTGPVPVYISFNNPGGNFYSFIAY